MLGPARAGKTHELLSRYFLSLTTGSTTALDRRLWIAPNPRAATLVRDALLDRGGTACLAPGITTFDGLSKEIVFAADLKIRQITRVQQRELLRRTVAMALAEEKLQFFAEAARRSGFIDLFAEHIRELRQRDISPSAYQQIATTRGQPIQHRELALLYTHYDRQLAAHHLCDGEGIYWAARDVLAKGDCRRFAKLDLVVVDGFTDFTRTQHEILCLLADRSERLFISLPTGAVEDGARTDLFAKTTATLVELKDAFPNLKSANFLREGLSNRPSITSHETFSVIRKRPHLPMRLKDYLVSKLLKPPAFTMKLSSSPVA